MTAMLTLATSADPATANDAYFLWGCILFGVAVVLLFLELLVPSGGLIGVLCGVAAVASVVAFFQYDPTWGVVAALGYIVLSPIALVFVFKLWLNSPIAKLMILGDSAPAEHSKEDAARASDEERRRRLAELKQLIGDEGVSETALRPVGTVSINGQRLDGLAESGIIEANTPIVVTDVYDNQVKVRPR
jgi:membrane-bound serine protease (ClpP class)